MVEGDGRGGGPDGGRARVGGVAGSQGEAFAVQYIQRLGGHLDEARDHLADVQSGLRYRVMGDVVRDELEAKATNRFKKLKHDYDAIAHGNVITRPFAFARAYDPAALDVARRGFKPALPATAPALSRPILD